MSVRYGSLPSLRQVSSRIYESLAAPKLVLINFPNSDLMEGWRPVLIDALGEHLLIKDRIDELVEVHIDHAEDEPLDRISDALGETLACLDDFLYVRQSDPAVIFNWDSGSAMPDDWHSFLANVIDKIKESDQSRYFRKIIILNGGNGELPEYLYQSPSVTHLSLWNALTWEEFRLFTSLRITGETNEIRKAWMICTYCGAANFDLKILEALIEARPMSIQETVDIALEKISGEMTLPRDGDLIPDKSFGNEWLLPASLQGPWAAGHVIGASIERGLIRPWGSRDSDIRQGAAHHFIWKEQVSGLFPLLIELGHELNTIIIRRGGSKLAHLGKVFLEPKEMLVAVEGTVWIPENLVKALRKLKAARNNLAHLRPLERTDLEAIWDIQLRIRAGQY